MRNVEPTHFLGIEVNAYAQQLAQVVVWIGYLQWMIQNGFAPERDPVLKPFESIRLMDAVPIRALCCAGIPPRPQAHISWFAMEYPHRSAGASRNP